MTGNPAFSGRERRGYADCSIGQVHYREMGNGHPLVLLHQNPNSAAMFTRVYPLLAAAGFRAIGFDHPGCAMSDPPPAPPRIGDYARWLLEAIDGLGLDRFHLVGHHTGSAIATEIAILAGDRIPRLVLSGTPVFDADQLVKVDLWSQPRQLAADGSHLQVAWDKRIAATPHWSSVEAMHRAVIWSLVAGDSYSWGFLAGMQYPMAERLPLVTQETLLLTARFEDVYQSTLRAHRIRPDWDLVALGNVTRDVPDERPEAFAAAITRFLSRPPRGQP